jgi:hypothetical protein
VKYSSPPAQHLTQQKRFGESKEIHARASAKWKKQRPFQPGLIICRRASLALGSMRRRKFERKAARHRTKAEYIARMKRATGRKTKIYLRRRIEPVFVREAGQSFERKRVRAQSNAKRKKLLNEQLGCSV